MFPPDDAQLLQRAFEAQSDSALIGAGREVVTFKSPGVDIQVHSGPAFALGFAWNARAPGRVVRRLADSRQVAQNDLHRPGMAAEERSNTWDRWVPYCTGTTREGFTPRCFVADWPGPRDPTKTRREIEYAMRPVAVLVVVVAAAGAVAATELACAAMRRVASTNQWDKGHGRPEFIVHEEAAGGAPIEFEGLAAYPGAEALLVAHGTACNALLTRGRVDIDRVVACIFADTDAGCGARTALTIGKPGYNVAHRSRYTCPMGAGGASVRYAGPGKRSARVVLAGVMGGERLPPRNFERAVGDTIRDVVLDTATPWNKKQLTCLGDPVFVQFVLDVAKMHRAVPG